MKSIEAAAGTLSDQVFLPKTGRIQSARRRAGISRRNAACLHVGSAGEVATGPEQDLAGVSSECGTMRRLWRRNMSRSSTP